MNCMICEQARPIALVRSKAAARTWRYLRQLARIGVGGGTGSGQLHPKHIG